MAVSSPPPLHAAAALKDALEQALVPLEEVSSELPGDFALDVDGVSAEVQQLQQVSRQVYAARQQREQLLHDVAALRHERETIRQEMETLVRLGLERRREAAEDVERLERRSRELLAVVNALARQVLATLDTAAQLSATLDGRADAALDGAVSVEAGEADLEPRAAAATVHQAAEDADAATACPADAAVEVEAPISPQRVGRWHGLMRWLGLRPDAPPPA